MSEKASLEHREQPKNYELFISITRHGPKGGQHMEDLSEAGKQDVAEYFYQSYKGVPIDNRNRRVATSTVKRVVQSGQIAEHSLQSYNEAEPTKIELDERLAEQGIDAIVKQLPPEQKRDWFRGWYQSELMPPAVADYAKWILEKIETAKTQGGKFDIDAYSHGPLMAAFLLRLEDNLDVQFIGRKKDDPLRLNRDKLLGEGGEFDYLSNFNIQISSKSPEIIRIIFRGKEVEIPVSALRELV